MNKYILFEDGKVTDISDEYKENYELAFDIEKHGIPKIGDTLDYYIVEKSNYIRKSGKELWILDSNEIPPNVKVINGEFVEKTLSEKFDCGCITEFEYKVQRKFEILEELEQLDKKTTRPLRAILSGRETEEDKETLKSLETQAEDLRKELNSINIDEDDL